MALRSLSKERREWGESGQGGARRERVFFSSPLPSPLPFFRRSTYPKGCYFYSPQSSCHTIKHGGYNNTNINKLSPTQNKPSLQAKTIKENERPSPL